MNVFHTNDDEVWTFLSQFTYWHYFCYKIVAFVHGKLMQVPFNPDSLYSLFSPCIAARLKASLISDYCFGASVPIYLLRDSTNPDLVMLSGFIFDNIFKGYSEKQWDMYVADIDKSILKRVPINISRDDRYFKDWYQGIQAAGYTMRIMSILREGSANTVISTWIRLCARLLIWRGKLPEAPFINSKIH